jgi:hypothetical protein
LDNSKPFTVVTQFITDNNQSSGKLVLLFTGFPFPFDCPPNNMYYCLLGLPDNGGTQVEIRRKFKQNGKVIEHPSFNIGTYSCNP